MLAGGGALDIVPPIAGEELLAKDGAIRTEEGILSAAHIANVKHLFLLDTQNNVHEVISSS